MSFRIDAFDNVTSGMSRGPKIWSYSSSTDTLAEILAADYFEEVKERLYRNDLIYVAATDDVELIRVTSENGDTPTTVVFVPASGGAPSDATYITQTPNVDLGNEQALSLLASGILKSETGTGVVSIAIPNTDYQVGSPALTSISGLTTAADEMIYTTASNTYATTGLTASGRALLDDATAGDQRNSLGLGTIATQNSNNVTITGGSISGVTGVVTGVTGTTNRITSSGGATPAIDISASYVGQSSITTVGTLSSGLVPITIGGTGQTTNTAAINALVNSASLTTATVATGDLVLIQDISDSNNLKSVTAQSIANLSAGGVTSVTGTVNRITSTGGTTPVIDISASYVGQSSITTLGTISSGVWGSSATLIAPASGGTGVSNTGTITVGGNTAFSGAFTFAGTVTGNTTVTFPTTGTLQTTTGASGTVNSGTANQIAYYATSTNAVSGLTGANGSVLVTNNTGVPSMLANPAASGRVLQSANAAIPVWSTSSYADTYAVSTILYASSANTVAGLATANNSILVTSSGGVPSLSGTLPFTVPVTTGGTGLTTMTTAYAPVISGTTATGNLQVASTGLATSGFVLTSNGASAVPSFQAVSAPAGTPVTVSVPMTLAQFQGMKVTPFQIIAAQGANTLIVAISIIFELKMAGAAFTSGGTTGLQYGNTASLGGPTIAFMAASLITAPTVGQIVNLPLNWFTSSTTPGTVAKSTTVNTAVFISNQTAAFTGGAGATVVIHVTYVVLTTS